MRLDLLLTDEALIQAAVQAIAPPDPVTQKKAQDHLDDLTKPTGSLGRLEALAVQLAGITGSILPEVAPGTIVVMAGDHGVTAEGVSAYPSEVTPQMVLNFLNGGAAINVLSRAAGLRVRVVDMGVATEVCHPGLEVRAPRRGTANMAHGPAMTREEACAAVAAGIRIAQEEVAAGTRLVCLGEMGIGNTTSSSAILSAMTGIPAGETVGRGTGIGEDAWRNKVSVVEQALAVTGPNQQDPIDVLQKVGGLEIGGLAGVILGAAAGGIPVLLDGFIAGAAALLACSLQPLAREYCIASHRSVEVGHEHLLRRLALQPLLQLDLRLGEGTGAALAYPIVRAATAVVREMATFSGAGVSGKLKP